MIDRITHRHSVVFSLFLFALLAGGCDEAEEAPAAEPAAEAPPVEEAPPEPPAPPAGWEAIEVQVQGHPFTTLVPTEEQRVEASERATAIYGDLPGQSYPYWFSLKHHDEAPTLRSILNKRGLEQEDTDFGFRAELREEDGNGWAYAVYNDAEKVSCTVRLSAGNGVSDELIEEARRPCDRLTE